MKRDSISLSCHSVYKEKILLPGDGSQGMFSSASLPLAEIQVGWTWSLEFFWCNPAVHKQCLSNLLTSVMVSWRVKVCTLVLYLLCFPGRGKAAFKSLFPKQRMDLNSSLLSCM